MDKIITITVKGIPVSFSCKQDLQALRDNAPELFNAIRTNNATLIQWALELYMDALEAQDAKASTGSYGKLTEVMERVQDALDTNSRVYLHDIRCRRIGMDDYRKAGVRYEYKTGFAQWAYGINYNECMEKLKEKARKGIVVRWDPFKDGRMIEMLLSDLLEVLASYKPEKGLTVWFTFKPAKNQLQMQPVKNSKKREQFIRNLLNK